MFHFLLLLLKSKHTCFLAEKLECRLLLTYKKFSETVLKNHSFIGIIRLGWIFGYFTPHHPSGHKLYPPEIFKDGRHDGLYEGLCRRRYLWCHW